MVSFCNRKLTIQAHFPAPQVPARNREGKDHEPGDPWEKAQAHPLDTASSHSRETYSGLITEDSKNPLYLGYTLSRLVLPPALKGSLRKAGIH